ncbi:MAG: hypothetical protein HYT03_00230 [Candidatus Harrisonbacteria bacterium]|nr:hypothetical protein [Candidatus Harrisonbacteria bacterium]
MKQRIADRNLAIQLRREGKSYNEIRSVILNLAKSTLSGWLRNIDLSEEQMKKLEKRINNKLEKARFAAAKTNRAKRLLREVQIYRESTKEFPKFVQSPLFLIGLTMYWAEGSKRSNAIDLINSEPHVIKLMIKWFNKFLNIPLEKMKFRLYTHKQFAKENLENFWANELRVNISQFKKTIYKPSNHNFKKRPDYKGCLRIMTGSVDKFRKILNWQKALVKKFII